MLKVVFAWATRPLLPVCCNQRNGRGVVYIFGIAGHDDPRFNREVGYGRYDIMPEPVEVRPGSLVAFGALKERPCVTIEVKFSRECADEEELRGLADQAFAQIEERGYDADPLPKATSGRLRWGIALGGKRIVARCRRLVWERPLLTARTPRMLRPAS